MITFEQARALVFDYLKDEYPAAANFTTATWGDENTSHYHVICGPHAVLYEPKSSEATRWLSPNDGQYVTVDKSSGEVRIYQGPDANGERYKLPDATPVGG